MFKIDSVYTPSEEAKICLNCPKKKCNPGTCMRLQDLRRKLRRNKKRKCEVISND